MSDAAHAAVVGHEVRLGKKEAKHDPRNFKLRAYLKRPKQLLDRAPMSSHYGRNVIRQGGTFPMYGNDRLGDCTCAAAGHHEQVWSYNEGTPETPAEKAILDLYWKTGSLDDGRQLDDVLREWRTGGLAGEEILGYAAVNVKDHDEVKAAHWIFGGLYIGVGLPITAQRQTTWHVDRNASEADQAPYSWGGHCVNVSGYTTTTGLYCVTWGALVRMTWAFWDEYVDEAFAIISPDWISSGKTPVSAGSLDIAKLEADLAQL
jgi:hypothetical protein